MAGFFNKVASGFAFGFGASIGHALFGFLKMLVGLVLLALLVVFALRLLGGSPVDLGMFTSLFQWVMGAAFWVRDWLVMAFSHFAGRM